MDVNPFGALFSYSVRLVLFSTLLHWVKELCFHKSLCISGFLRVEQKSLISLANGLEGAGRACLLCVV